MPAKSPVRFVIFSYPRTGSTYLVKMLNSSPDVICYSELFHKSKNSFERSLLDQGLISRGQKKVAGIPVPFLNPVTTLFKLRNEDSQKFLNLVWSEPKAEAVGFKIFPGQDEKVFHSLLTDQSVKKILLHRQNTLRSFISELLATKNNKWDRFSGEEAVLQQIEVPFHLFLNYHEQTNGLIQKITETIHNTGNQFLTLTYESMTTQFPISQLSDFLSIQLKPDSSEVNQEKQNPFSLEEIITNYAQLKTQLTSIGLDYLLVNE